MIKITFDARTLKAALLCTSTDETRYYLKGVAVQLDADKLFIVATDGHRLLAMQPEFTIESGGNDANPFTETQANPFLVIIPAHIVKDLKLSRGDDSCTLTIDGNKGELEHAGQAVRFNFIDGTFPAWRNVIPARITGETAQFDARYLGDLPKIKAAFGDKVSKIEIEHNGDSPAFVALELPMPYVCLLMPFRAAKEPVTLPAWIKTVRGAPAQSQAA